MGQFFIPKQPGTDVYPAVLSQTPIHWHLISRPHLSAVARKENNMSSHDNPVEIPLYWLVDRDPYIGLWNNPYIVE